MALNPHKKNKVDISQLTEEEANLFRRYGKLPDKKDLLTKKLSERKYFDSGDYALSKAGKADTSALGGGLGSQHPTPENIPHLSQQVSNGGSGGTGTTAPEGSRGSFSEGSRGSVVAGLGQGTPGGIPSGSPVKEGSVLQREMGVDDEEAGKNGP
ncbi:related to cAMP-regulated phosphoprotein family protein Igo1, putative [Ramularia collo-cygni]|uniref:mRNA stability protein n=1 Tax=Ramularia collo-cygni TaxID=112498 RepID=A0A2D3UWD1_9PEZI|nr:related to cAMP-regulated phosphoprotein family protein Igo1, putative [Ramularia collo-cygni]CZT17410.1 related to cAMP-regulated phosphoprotein family protein Igo1, putative [Ramularia collo-cygni]